MEEFVSSFGRTVARFPGYKDLHPRKKAEDHDSKFLGLEEKATYYQFLKDTFEYGMMVDQLNSVGVYGPWRKALDIGGAEATISRLLKAEGLARYVACADIKDFSRTLPDSLFLKFLLRFKAQSRMHRSRFLTSKLLNKFPEHFGYVPRKCDKFWNISLRKTGKLDEYFTKNIYDLEGEYDFISALLCLPYFEYRKLIRKVASLMPTGAIFYIISDYWWWPVNSSGIVGGFPYACQRLTQEDLFRCFADQHPEELEMVRERSKYFNQGQPAPTLGDISQAAHDSGFTVLSANRYFTTKPDLDRTFMTPAQIEASQPNCLSETLADIHCFRKDVQRMDLETAFVSLVLQKR